VIIPNRRFTFLTFSWPFAWLALLVPLAVLLASSVLIAQSVGTGSIVGAVTDQEGKLLPGARVEITNKATSAVIHVSASSAGFYTSGPIQPGDYALRVEAKGFKEARFRLVVEVGNATHQDAKMKPAAAQGAPTEVLGGTVVNIDQATVQGVLSGEQAEQLPISGRNYLDLAQLEPGVQLQDGGVLDPGKNGIFSVSLLNRFGRDTRVSVDGVDISDEIVGATTQNLPSSAILEFQLPQSVLDASTGLTSSGAVNVITRSGGDHIHGEMFGVFRGDQVAAALPGSPTPSFQREQFGGNAGGAIIKDKVFVFVDAERVQQNLTAAESFTYPFNGPGATLAEPYREFDTDERVDWNMRRSTRAFYRFNYFQDSDFRPFSAASSTQQVRNTNNTVTNTLGVDFNTGVYTHSLRFEYLKLRSGVNDATSALSGIDNPIPGLGLNIGAPFSGNCVLSDGGSYCGGPSWLAPEQELQSDKLARYDGSRVLARHIIRYGIAFNRIDGARLAAFSAFPQAGTTSLGGSLSSDPTSYPADWVSLGNGIEFHTPNPAFGFRAGGVNPDNRIELYAADAWRITPKLTFTYGLHYVHDTGRSDSNLGGLPDLNQWGAGYGNPIRNPGLDFAPQVGFAWDAGGDGKTVIRLGGGLFYANSLANNALFDPAARLSKGIFANTPQVCSGGIASPFLWPVNPGALGASVAGGAGTVVMNPTTGALEVSPNFCGGTISTVGPSILALSSAYQSATASVAPGQPNSSFVGSALTALNPSYDLLFPGYRTPRAWQMNLGIEKELSPGRVLSIDYVRNVGEHFLIGQDINHSGAARSFNEANALAARDAAQVANGCLPGLAQATCMISKLGQAGAQAAYSAAGLDSNLQLTGGAPCSYCAFPGTNSVTGNLGAVGGVDMLYPDGRSLYSGFQGKLVQRISHPIGQVKGATFEASYTNSRFDSQQQDQDFVNMATDNDDPTRFTGPSALDRRHQISFGGTLDLPWRIKFSMVGHFLSPLAESLQLPELTNGGEIFATDWLGTGLPAGGAPELVPGTNIGQFQRNGTDIDSLQEVINKYNHTYAGNLTPAGACLVTSSTSSPSTNPFQCPGQIAGASAVMLQSDMVALGWVMPTLDSVSERAVGFPWQESLDLKVAWPVTLKDRITIEPSASVFNVLNLYNAFLPGNLPSSSLVPGQNGTLAPNVVGGVSPGTNLAPYRTNFQSGTFAAAAPRMFEFGLRISF
jgi:Carboxypeptidase regulatory-like domain